MSLARLTPFEAGLVDGACDRFEACWRAGRPLRIEAILGESAEQHRAALLRELLALELEPRRAQGESPEPGAYIARFPEHALLVDAAFEAAPTLRAARESSSHAGLSHGSLPRVPGFEMECEIGRGGMGVVYRARQVRLNRSCALKMMLAGAHAGTHAAPRFMAEAETAARLRHPNIVQIHSYGEHEGCPYVEFEFVEGGSLAERLDGSPWRPREAARLVETLAVAIAAAHAQGIVHRDLKPANVLLTAAGAPRISDFGLAKALDSGSGLTHTGAILGTPNYMAPEQAEGRTKEVTPAADVYALGAILYELLTGRPPFRAPTVLQTLELIRSSEPLPPSRLRSGLPGDLETIVLKCLQKAPAARYDSALALAEDLGRFGAGSVVLARRAGPVERAWRWCRRNRAVAALAAAVFVLLVAVAAGSTFAALRLRDAAARERRQAEESRGRLVRLNLAEALRLIDAGDLLGGLPWLLEASRLEGPSGHGAAIHRERLDVVLAQCPRLARLWSQPSPPAQAAFSPDGARLAAAGEDGTVRFWDVESSKPAGAWPVGAPASLLAFSPDGARLAAVWSSDRASGERHVVGLWDVARSRPVGVPRHEALHVFHAAFSPDGSRLLLALGQRGGDPLEAKGEVRVVDAATGRPLGAPLAVGGPVGPPLRHTAPLLVAGMDGDGRFVTALGQDGVARCWDLAAGAAPRHFGTTRRSSTPNSAPTARAS